MTTNPLRDQRVTFQNAHPDKGDDVVLCKFCGEVLHAPEEDVFWKDTANHECKEQLKARATAAEADAARLAKALDHMIDWVSGSMRLFGPEVEQASDALDAHNQRVNAKKENE